jgi:AcrR family transcriptional regulator
VSAERLFCVNGYEGTKIRAIATLSNANLGMLSHYWGSKRALFREVFDRRLRPIHDERMRRFRTLEKNMKTGKPVSIAEVLQAQIEPSFILPGQSAAEANARRLLLGRALTDPSSPSPAASSSRCCGRWRPTSITPSSTGVRVASWVRSRSRSRTPIASRDSSMKTSAISTGSRPRTASYDSWPRVCARRPY